MRAAAISPERERAVLRRLRDIAAQLDGDEWQIDADDRGMHVVTRRADGQEAVICHIDRQALPEEARLISNALSHLHLFLRLFDRARDRVLVLEERCRRPAPSGAGVDKNYSAQAAMMLKTGAFQRFLSEKLGGPVDDEAGADACFKDLTGIKRKRDINANERARAAFLSLRAEFEAWKQGVLP